MNLLVQVKHSYPLCASNITQWDTRMKMYDLYSYRERKRLVPISLLPFQNGFDAQAGQAQSVAHCIPVAKSSVVQGSSPEHYMHA